MPQDPLDYLVSKHLTNKIVLCINTLSPPTIIVSEKTTINDPSEQKLWLISFKIVSHHFLREFVTFHSNLEGILIYIDCIAMFGNSKMILRSIALCVSNYLISEHLDLSFYPLNPCYRIK